MINFATVSSEEAELCDGLYWMAESFLPQSYENFSPLDLQVHDALVEYGLKAVGAPRYIILDDQLTAMTRAHANLGGKDQILFSAVRDRNALNQRSERNLRLLARYSEQHLTYEDGLIWHNLCGEREQALHLLCAYGLMKNSEIASGHHFQWTSEGEAVLRQDSL